ncbi:hypothetical protein BD311DRAFT_732331 [Dichomitus squalens]|uniref:Uncharacterized protein n=1 Tax=Dichomitus squalens TaxID=114155 RepID=A0A4Q9M7E4_9APHY|nr:hypothetical protein BD311DRAFT_732331 [Dichomitus squalens]TBU64279.1 hypothetical protein BD310DRAFT_391063 [Dichomitus squalens]
MHQGALLGIPARPRAEPVICMARNRISGYDCERWISRSLVRAQERPRYLRSNLAARALRGPCAVYASKVRDMPFSQLEPERAHAVGYLLERNLDGLGVLVLR